MDYVSQPLSAMRAVSPLVHNITNFVSMNIMANVMLAIGASPAMVHAREEVEEFVKLSSSLNINIGTLDREWANSMEAAVATASVKGIPWVLDPVAVGATSFRRKTCARLLEFKPAIIRGNASEIMALSGISSTGRGVDSGDDVSNAENAAVKLASKYNTVVVVTGKEDFITDGDRAVRIANGVAMMSKVTALGCSLTGVVAAFAATSPAYDASISAVAYYGTAGELASRNCSGPGTFQQAFVDALYKIDGEYLNLHARVQDV